MIEDGTAELYLERLALLGLDHVLPAGSLGPDKVLFALRTQQFYSFLDTATLCQFVWGPAWTLYGPRETVTFGAAGTEGGGCVAGAGRYAASVCRI